MHLREDDLELYARGRLSADLRLTIQGHLAECTDCTRLLAATQSFLEEVDSLTRRQLNNSKRPDRRAGHRTPTDDAGTIRAVNPLSPDRWAIRILNASKNGLKVVAPVCMQPGTTVQIRIEGLIAFAEVRHCTKVGAEFHIGVQVQDTLAISNSP